MRPWFLLVEGLLRFPRGHPRSPGTWFLWVGRNRAHIREKQGAPGFTGNPLVSMPRASDSGDPGHASHNGVPDTAFRPANGVGIAMRSISELIPHGLLTHCVRFAPASHPTNGNTRCRPARYGFDRAGLAPAGLHQEVSLTHRSSSSSALIPARSQSGRVDDWRGGDRRGIAVSAPFGSRCPTSRSMAPFPVAAHRTGRADLPHPALGQDACLRPRKVASKPAEQQQKW